jgi:hypothetical protein
VASSAHSLNLRHFAKFSRLPVEKQELSRKSVHLPVHTSAGLSQFFFSEVPKSWHEMPMNFLSKGVPKQ